MNLPQNDFIKIKYLRCRKYLNLIILGASTKSPKWNF